MTDPANDSMTAEQYRNEYGDDGLTAARGYDSAVAIDPGTTTGVALYMPTETDEHDIQTGTFTFWQAIEVSPHWRDSGAVAIVEAPYATEWGKAQDNSAMAYNSGQVAREAELLVLGLRRKGLDVIEHDPHSSGCSNWGEGKDGSEFIARRIVGDWEGPDNDHTRDAIKLLFIYGFIG